MNICLLCNQNDGTIKLRNEKAVCPDCLLQHETFISKNQDRINFLNKIKLILSICVFFAFVSVGVFLSFQFNHLIILFIAIVLYFSLTENGKIKFNPIERKIEKLKVKQNSNRDVLRNIYADFWELPPDWEWRRKKIIEKARGKCENCGRHSYRSVVPFHVHHKIPKIQRIGNHTLDNLILLCEICHSKIPESGHQLVKRARDKRLMRRRGRRYTRYSNLFSVKLGYNTSDKARFDNLKRYLEEQELS